MKKGDKNLKKNKVERDLEDDEIYPIDKNSEEDLLIDLEELSEGDDPVEMDILEADKIVFGSSFSPMDGNDGDESEDVEDLPDELKRQGQRFDPTLSSGGRIKKETEEWEDGLFINDMDNIGMGFGENDYAEEWNDYD